MVKGAYVEIVDKDGWRKQLTLEKPIVHIGSDPRSDIVLEPMRGGGVATLHAQLIGLPNSSGYQIVNLSDTSIPIGASGDQTLPARTAARLNDGTTLRIGEFTLIFRDGESAPGSTELISSHIGLRLSAPNAKLQPNRTMAGVLKVSNLGDRSGAQFNLELEGLPVDCYDIEPGPILASGAERDVVLRLYHRGDRPSAGEHRVTIRATADDAYPGEESEVSLLVQVLPLFRHQMRLIAPAQVRKLPPGSKAQAQMPAADVPPIRAPEPEVPAQPSVVSATAGAPAVAGRQDWWTPTATGAQGPATLVSAPAGGASPVGSAPQPVTVAPVVPVEVPAPTSPAAAPEAAAAAASGSPATTPVTAVATEPAAPLQLAEVAASTASAPEIIPAEEVQDVRAVPEPEVLAAGQPPPGTEPQMPGPAPVEAPPPVAAPVPPATQSPAGRTVSEGEAAAEPDWWAEPPAADEDGRSERAAVLKLRAAQPAESGAETSPGPGRAPGEAEEWWSSEWTIETGGAVENTRKTEIRPALRLKATAPEESEPEVVPPSGSRSATTDTWISP